MRERFYDNCKAYQVKKKNYTDLIFNKSYIENLLLKYCTSDAWIYDEALTTDFRKSNLDNSITVYSNKFGIAFDIETTAVKRDDGSIRAYMYHAQIGIGDTIVHLTEWEDIKYVFETIINTFILNHAYREGKKTCIRQCRIWVANLGYEFQFMRNRLVDDEGRTIITNVFSKDQRKPVKVITRPGLIFQDALQISNLSLEKTAQLYNLPTQKTHDLDYSVIRNTLTPLSNDELYYMSADVRILLEMNEFLIKTYCERGLKMPLTLTGMLRHTLKANMSDWAKIEYTKANKRYTAYDKKKIKALVDCLPETYDDMAHLINDLFRGAYVHANVKLAGINIADYNDDISGWDITSSYIAVLLQERYPITKFRPLAKVNGEFTIEDILKLHDDGKASTAKYTFYNIRRTTPHSIESMHKCLEYHGNKNEFKKVTGAILDNGRIAVAVDHITVYLTDIDLINFQMFYKWDNVVISDVKISKYGELPDYVKWTIIKSYAGKVTLKAKGLDETPQYKIEKSKVCSVFGLMCEHMHLEDVKYIDNPDGKSWVIEFPSLEYLETDYYNSVFGKNYVNDGTKPPKVILSPYWGIYCTAYSRNRLFTILKTINTDAIYCDTDSLYAVNASKWTSEIKRFNEKIQQKNLEWVTAWNAAHDFNLVQYNALEGKEAAEYIQIHKGVIPSLYMDLGFFDVIDKQKRIVNFKTLGAKSYIKQYSDGTFKQQISGLPKTALNDYCTKYNLDPFTVFNSDMVIKDVKKMCSYSDTPHSDIVTDQYGNTETMNELSSVAVYNTDFSMVAGSEYVNMVLGSMKHRKAKEYKCNI